MLLFAKKIKKYKKKIYILKWNPNWTFFKMFKLKQSVQEQMHLHSKLSKSHQTYSDIKYMKVLFVVILCSTKQI